MNFTEKKYDVFQMFNDRWALVTAGTPEDFNTMTIAWAAWAPSGARPTGGSRC